MKPLLILRPEPGASATAKRARAMGLNPVSLPLFVTEPLEWTAPEPKSIDALLVTSAAAMRHGGAALMTLKALPLFAVGEATAAAARAAGFTQIIVGDADGEASLTAAAQAGYRRILRLVGQDHRPLAHVDVALETRLVYAAKSLQAPHALEKHLSKPAIVLVHSPRAAAHFATLCLARQDITLVAISIAAAERAGSGWAECLIAQTPTDNAMLALAAQVCENG